MAWERGSRMYLKWAAGSEQGWEWVVGYRQGLEPQSADSFLCQRAEANASPSASTSCSTHYFLVTVDLHGITGAGASLTALHVG